MAIFTEKDLLISIGGGCMTEFQLRNSFTNYSCAPSLHSMPLAYRQLIAISEIVDEVVILCPRDSIFSEEASKIEDIATIIWTDHIIYCDKQDMSLEINYKGEKGWIENVIPRFLV